MNVRDLYASLVPGAVAAYAEKSPDMASAKQMGRALATECALECARLGIVEGDVGTPQPQQVYGVGTPGIPSFAETKFEGPGAMAITPPGAPNQQAQHYNHVPAVVGGQQIFPPAGGKYEPPLQAGVMGTVVQAPNPQGYNALGTNGVIQQPEQRPNGRDVVVAPGNQPMIPAVGGSGTMFVPEKIVR